jgi:hypothetical protein
MRRPSWLRWQAVTFSPWLLVTILLGWILYLALTVGPYWSQSGRAFWRAYVASAEHHSMYGLSVLEIVLWLLLTATLIWFTYFAKNPRVKDSDKFAVFLMLNGAAVGWIVLIVRILARS